uniref:Zinc finger, FYVE domain containing 16 n=1 Tax=Myripristis murdjan TaxID=586833 RepID=A0A667YX57_9TELE
MPSACPFSSLGSQRLSSEASTVSQNLPDLNSLHYGSAPSCPDRPASHNHSPSDSEVKGEPLIAVDLLSSVDHRPAKSSAPPCPDRALKPVCDLVNDTSSAILARANSHDAFSELDMVEKQMEAEGALLVDFNSPAVSGLSEEVGGLSLGADTDTEVQQASGVDSHELVGRYSASLSLLDVILPAAVERGNESADDSLSPGTVESADKEEEEDEEVASMKQQVDVSSNYCEQEAILSSDIVKGNAITEDNKEESQGSLDAGEAESPASLSTSDSEPVGLSCLPLAVSMCGALVNPKKTDEQSGQAAGQSNDAEISKSTEEESALEDREDSSHSEEPVNSAVSLSEQTAEGRVSPEEQHLSVGSPGAPSVDISSSHPPEPSSVDFLELGLDYLSESDRAELLVTDEELDAFLQAHADAQQVEGVSYCSRSEGISEVNGDLEDRLVEEELRSCGRVRQEELEGLASPESDRTICMSVEGSFNPALPSLSQDSCQLDTELPSSVSHTLTNNTYQSQHSGSPDPQPPYGGARPKQLHCQAARSPPAGGDVEEEKTQPPSDTSEGPSAIEDEGNSPTSPPSPNPTEDPSNSSEPSPVYAPQELQGIVGYDELSEPPPYPGEPSRDGARTVDEKGEDMEGLGCRQPTWVPDAEAPNCMKCLQRFTFTKRRHHCRACGKVYCAGCCNRKCKLKYLEKEARVCIICFETIHRAQALERMMSPTGPSPNPNVPSEYCSTIPPLQQARAAGTLNSPPPTVMVPVSVLKHPSNDSCPREQKRVWFADGILPNGEVADTTKLSVTSRRSPQESSGTSPDPMTVRLEHNTHTARPQRIQQKAEPVSTLSLRTDSSPAGSEGGVAGSVAPEASGTVEAVRPLVSGPWDYALLCAISSSVERMPTLLPENEEELPPLLIITGEDEAGDVLVEERPAPCQILLLLEEGGPRPLTFVLNANLLVNVKLVTYCGRRCWFFGSNGLQALGQKELVFLLECLPEEKTLPKDLFTLYLNIYQDAQKGKGFVEDLGNVTLTSSFLGSKEHGGMLFFSPTCQPLDGLTLPPQPFLFGLLIHRLEVPWAKVFPLRLLLRLGAEHSAYPTTLISVRFRDSVYRETGHTIMNLLADLRNYQYSLPVVEGLRIHMEMGHSYVDIPKSRFNEVVNASNEHVISIGASFSSEADSHLVCFQNEEGNYQTQANSMPGKTRTVTGASFVVFNGALKASSGFIAKSSIVEDGLMVQIPPETMESLRTALREQTDFQIPCGKNDGGELRENVTVRWVNWSAPVNMGVTSGVDGRPLDGVHSVRMQQDTEFESDGRSIRCTEVFYQLKNPDSCLATVLPSCSVFQKEMALATCSALTPHLAVLTASGINSLSLRVSTQADMVEYQAGSGSKLLPQRYMNELDSALIPVIHGGSTVHLNVHLIWMYLLLLLLEG